MLKTKGIQSIMKLYLLNVSKLATVIAIMMVIGRDGVYLNICH